MFVWGKDTNSAAESVSLGNENGEASIPAVPARWRAHPVPGEFPAPAASLVHAILLSQLDQRLLADYGADPFWGQGALLCARGKEI